MDTYSTTFWVHQSAREEFERVFGTDDEPDANPMEGWLIYDLELRYMPRKLLEQLSAETAGAFLMFQEGDSEVHGTVFAAHGHTHAELPASEPTEILLSTAALDRSVDGYTRFMTHLDRINREVGLPHPFKLPDICECNDLGWSWMTDHIERCDLCRRFEDDDEASAAFESWLAQAVRLPWLGKARLLHLTTGLLHARVGIPEEGALPCPCKTEGCALRLAYESSMIAADSCMVHGIMSVGEFSHEENSGSPAPFFLGSKCGTKWAPLNKNGEVITSDSQLPFRRM